MTNKKSRASNNQSLQRVFCDFHVHSMYSRATSPKMDVESIAHFAQLKGLNLVGTGDFTHPRWIKDLKNSLSEIPEADLYQLKATSPLPTFFMVTGEVCTIFDFQGKIRKIHHLLLAPNLETAEQINDRIKVYGDLTSDGRPTLKMAASELVEEVMEISRENAVIPAHAWTPWFSLFGSINGFDRIEDCYEDTTKHIFALETGLSSDPPMNWRLSCLNKFALVSNSDSHSPFPYRLGREANVFEVEKLSYTEILEAIRLKNPKYFKFTIETDPAYGKYHWTGHRSCEVSMPPLESKKLGGRCPACHRSMTRGVEERVDDLADMPFGFKPEGAIGYIHLIPLHEVIRAALGLNSLSSPSIWRVYNQLIAAFGNEYSVLLDTPLISLEKVVDSRIAEIITKIRSDTITIIPGYDGVYGKIQLFERKKIHDMHQPVKKRGTQSSLGRFL